MVVLYHGHLLKGVNKMAQQYSSIVTKTVANANSGSLLPATLGQFVGSVSFFDNLFLDNVGATITILATGVYGTKGGPVGTLRAFFSLDGITMLDTGTFTPLVNLVNQSWIMQCVLTVRSIGAGGTIIGQGLFRHQATSTSFAERPMINTTTTGINTTNLQTMDIQVAWQTADVANTISSTNILISIQ